MSDTLQPHKSQHTRPRCSSPTPGVYSNSCTWSHWWHPAISSSVVPFSSCPQSLPASGSFPMSQLFTWGGQSIGVSASASVLPICPIRPLLCWDIFLRCPYYWELFIINMCWIFSNAFLLHLLRLSYDFLILVLLMCCINGNPLQYSCWKTPWTEEPCRLQSMGSQRVRHNWVTTLT